MTDAWPGLEAFLEPETEVLVARNGAEVGAHLQRLDPVRAAVIGAAARRRVLAHPTFAHRAAQLERLLQGRGEPRTDRLWPAATETVMLP